MKRLLLLALLCIPSSTYCIEEDYVFDGFTQEECEQLSQGLRDWYIEKFCEELKKQYATGISLNKAIKATKKRLSQ
jgi:hypothetical protein